MDIWGKEKWFVLHVNPQPWAIGPLSLGRKAGGFFPRIGPNLQLVAYQNAVREELKAQGTELITGEVELKFYFYRAIESYTRASGRKSSANKSDTTNLQKATEDALQGILIENDRNVVAISSVILDQGVEVQPCIIIRVRHAGDYEDEIPPEVWDEVKKTNTELPTLSNWQAPSEDDF